jgi:hypothetical protein
MQTPALQVKPDQSKCSGDLLKTEFTAKGFTRKFCSGGSSNNTLMMRRLWLACSATPWLYFERLNRVNQKNIKHKSRVHMLMVGWKL